MFENRDFEPSSEESIKEFRLKNIDTGIEYVSPFSVVVFTADGMEPLGTGRLLGLISSEGYEVPVIEIDDADAPGGKVHLYGSECWWDPLTDEIVDSVAQSIDEIASAYQYVQRIDREYQAGLN